MMHEFYQKPAPRVHVKRYDIVLYQSTSIAVLTDFGI